MSEERELAVGPKGERLVAVPFETSLPDVDDPLASMFRLLGNNVPRIKSGTPFKTGEWASLTLSIASCLLRARYHRRRFKFIVAEATRRYERFHGRVRADTISKYIAFEAGACLMASRSLLDEVFYAALRRSGVDAASADAESLTANVGRKARLGYALPEVALLRSTHSKWFTELSDYRNAMVHRGSHDTLGFYPIGASWPEATNPHCNVMLVPDRASVVRPSRPHEWTYKDGNRLETLIESAVRGLHLYARDVGTKVWGAAIPPPGTATGTLGALLVRASGD